MSVAINNSFSANLTEWMLFKSMVREISSRRQFSVNIKDPLDSYFRKNRLVSHFPCFEVIVTDTLKNS